MQRMITIHNAYRLIIVCVAIAVLSGCGITSVRVSSIGARGKWGTQEIKSHDNVMIEIYDSEYVKDKKTEFEVYVPYRDLKPIDNGVRVGTISVNISDIKIYKTIGRKSHGTFSSELNGEPIIFETIIFNKDKYTSTLFLERRYRRWYGYPAQVLMLVAVPTDLVVGTAWVAGMAIISPISSWFHESKEGAP